MTYRTLAGRYCETCKADTIFKSVIGGRACIHCGFIWTSPKGAYFDRRRKKKRRDIAKFGLHEHLSYVAKKSKDANADRRKFYENTGTRFVDIPAHKKPLDW